jgi:hypothetical protein
MKTTGMGLTACRLLAAGLMRARKSLRRPAGRKSEKVWKKKSAGQKIPELPKKNFLTKNFLFESAE